MAALTPAKIAKLTPAQRKARAARLEYNRRYDAAKRDGKTVKRASPKRQTVSQAKVSEVVRKTQSRVDALEVCLSQLKSLQEQEDALINTLKTYL